MTPGEVTDLIRQTLFVALEISAPILIALLLIGLFISVLQSATQITELTLIFIPKLIGFVIIFVIFFPWILKIMIQYTNAMLIDQWDKVMHVSNNIL